MRNLVFAIGFLIILLSSCSSVTANHNAKLLFRVEERLIESDTIYEYDIFDDGLITKINTHNTNDETKLFNSEFKTLEKKRLVKFKDYLSQLEKLDYENDFPWKEDFYKRGNIYRIMFINKVTPSYFKDVDPKLASKKLSIQKVFYYYDGHKDSPEIFSKIVNSLHEVQ